MAPLNTCKNACLTVVNKVLFYIVHNINDLLVELKRKDEIIDALSFLANKIKVLEAANVQSPPNTPSNMQAEAVLPAQQQEVCLSLAQ